MGGSSPVVHIESSVDGSNWFLEAERTSGSFISLEGKAASVRATFKSGSGTVTVPFIAGN